MLIASVKMKALKLAFMTRKPLKMPTARPTSKTMSRPIQGFHSVPRPELALGAINQAPSSGARPNVPCSEMSNLPVSRMRDSATTTIPSAAPPVATSIRLELVKKTGLTIAPPIIKRTMTGTSVSSRNQLNTTTRAPLRASAGEGCFAAGSAAVSAIEALHRRDQLLAIPWRLVEPFRDLPSHHDLQSCADSQIIEVIGDQQHRHAFVTGTTDCVQKNLFRCHIHAHGRIHDDQHRRF